ncbi:hypothetical protein DMN50_09065, partial [Priestia megaterium]
IATLGHEGVSKGLDMEELGEKVSKISWLRMIDGKPNSLFTTGILNSDGKISNTRNSINATLSALKKQIIL